MAFAPAYREQVRLRLALMGLAGSGKTMSAMATAASISYEIRKRGGRGAIAVVDTERESAKLYAMSRSERNKYDAMSVDDGYAYIKQIRRYPIDVDVMDSFSPLAYVEKMQDAARLGYDILIVDSISHAWAGTGGALDRKGREEDRGANSWTAWRKITPEHNAFVDGMLGLPCHLIATVRMKSAHAMETGKDGKQKIVDLGTEEIQRDGVRYEFTLVGQIDRDHVLEVVKTRLDGVIENGERFERPGDAFGRRIYGWVNDGDEPAPKVEPQAPRLEKHQAIAVPPDAIVQLYALIDEAMDEVALKVHVPLITRLATEHPSWSNAIKAKYAGRKAEIKSTPSPSMPVAAKISESIGAAEAQEIRNFQSTVSETKSTRVDPPHLAVVEIKEGYEDAEEVTSQEGYET